MAARCSKPGCTAGAAARDGRRDEGEELVEVAIGGFRVCAVRRDDSVVCANAELGTPELVVLPGLPP
jgi:hypothetical protein